MKEKWIAYLKDLKREQIVVYVLLLLLLVIIALPTKKSKNTEETKETSQNVQMAGVTHDSQKEIMEKQLEEALSEVQGVGQVHVVLTLESSSTKIVEKDRPTSASSDKSEEDGRSQSSMSDSSEENTVYEKDSSGNQTPYVIAESYPQVRGVLVVCQGGDDPVVVQQISEGVMALFRVEAHKIKVMKMK